MHLGDIADLALQVRLAVLRWGRTNKDIDLDDGGLEGGCAVASWALCEVLWSHRVQADFVLGVFDRGLEAGGWRVRATHCWVLVGACTVDLTATQFSTRNHKYPPVYIALSDPDYKPEIVGATLKHVKDWSTQSPVAYKKHIERLVDRLSEVVHDRVYG